MEAEESSSNFSLGVVKADPQFETDLMTADQTLTHDYNVSYRDTCEHDTKNICNVKTRTSFPISYALHKTKQEETCSKRNLDIPCASSLIVKAENLQETTDRSRCKRKCEKNMIRRKAVSANGLPSSVTTGNSAITKTLLKSSSSSDIPPKDEHSFQAKHKISAWISSPADDSKCDVNDVKAENSALPSLVKHGKQTYGLSSDQGSRIWSERSSFPGRPESRHKTGSGKGESDSSTESDVSLKEESYEEIVAVKAVEDIFPCTMCNLTFTTDVLLQRHVYSLHCGDYDRSMPGASGVNHRTTKGGGQPAVTNSLNNSAESTTARYTSLADQSEHKCDICGKEFRRSGDLKRHLKVHNIENPPNRCPVCGKECGVSSHLQRHLRTHSGERPFKCTVCSKAFALESNLRKHMRIHNEEKPYECSVCDRTFGESSNLIKHMRIHNGEKPYKCMVCGKDFRVNSYLQAHMRIHNGEKPCKCHVCGKSFRVDCHLQIHLRIHNGEKPYKCMECDKTFRMSSNLGKHMRIHNKEKPHTCSICNRAFGESSNLRRHMRTHNQNYPCKCTMCGEAFGEISDLQRHMRGLCGEKSNCSTMNVSATDSQT